MGGEQVILATAGYDHTIRFWQAHSGVCTRTVQHPESQVNKMEITPDKQFLAAAAYQHVRLYDIPSANPSPVINYDGISKNVTAIGFQENGKWMFTGGEDKSVRIWDTRTRSLHCQHIFQVSAPVTSVFLHPNQTQLVIGDQSGAINMWDLKTDHNEQLIPETRAMIQSVAIDPEGKFLASINDKGTCYVWSLTGVKEQRTMFHPKQKLSAHNKYGLKCLFSPDSNFLVTTSADSSLKIWNTTDFSLLKTLTDPSGRWVWDCSFSEDSHYIITATSDGVGRLWNIDKEEIIREYTGHQKAIICLAFRDVKC
ncbi:target of rapamycin complex subunit lst8 [Hydra vulgaris]|uniref:Target of rapamycin complex subunit lst8 n=1 Tax=Hydra vulgaris TaxID=6087 RepID=T2M5T1_HYDVU